MKRRVAVLFAILVAALGTAAAPAAPVPPLAAAKPCSSGWTHGVVGGEHKCLRAGQYCARRYDSQYHRHGYHCHRKDGGVYRLTR